MTLSNDAEEGVWALKVLKAICETRVGSFLAVGKFSPWHLDRALGDLDSIRSEIDGLGLCFSSRRDMLSQWRGYADDGQGISIGFSETGLRSWATRKSSGERNCDLVQVIYERTQAIKELSDLAELIESHALKGAFDNPTPTVLSGKTDVEVEADKERISKAHREFQSLVIPRLLADLYRFTELGSKDHQTASM